MVSIRVENGQVLNNLKEGTEVIVLATATIYEGFDTNISLTTRTGTHKKGVIVKDQDGNLIKTLQYGETATISATSEYESFDTQVMCSLISK